MSTHPQIAHRDQALHPQPFAGKGFLRPTQLDPSEGKPQKETVVGFHYPALRLVHNQFEVAGLKPSRSGLDPFTRPLALHQNQQVVRVSDKLMTTFFKVLVEVTPARGEKCERCWIYREDVGSNSGYPSLCLGYAEVIAFGAIDES